MARWAPEKSDTLDALAAEILHSYGVGRAIVAVDGTSAAGTGVFADALAEQLRKGGRKVFRASIDDFHKPHTAWENQDLDSPQAYYAEAYDYSVFRRVLIDPFRASGSTGFVLAAYDAKREAAIQPKWMSAGSDAVLIVDGVFLNRKELAGLWSYSIFVEVPVEESNRETRADALYLAEVRPRAAVVAIIDNRDEEHPRRVFADSC
ncbi:uridine kinase [Glaciihabitans sp. UYNi722]|uniref:uridine kinase n=1 Tax=Glaciihabitans sp. UYNi722 TaxID=3156344 RepID=UPI00339A7510